MTQTHSPQIEDRRRKLMVARNEAVARRDWQAMNDITRKLAKLPVKTVGGYRYGA